MPKKRIIKSKLQKAQFTIHEQRIRLVDRVRSFNLRKPVSFTRSLGSRTVTFIRRRPFPAFFAVLLLLALLIILGSTIFKPKPLEEHKGEVIKAVETFKIGSSPKISVQAEVEKTGVIKVVALTPGVVSGINVYEGDSVSKGQSLVSLGSNYFGSNPASVGRQIAAAQYKLSKDTLDSQKEVITKQRQVAERTDANADEMRDIANRSIDETRSLLDLNESLLSTLNQNLTQYEATNSGGTNSNLIFQTNTQRSQFQAGNFNIVNFR